MYKLISKGKQFIVPIKKFFCDNFDDILTVTESISFGSVLYVINEHKYYIYNSHNCWMPQKGVVGYV